MRRCRMCSILPSLIVLFVVLCGTAQSARAPLRHTTHGGRSWNRPCGRRSRCRSTPPADRGSRLPSPEALGIGVSLAWASSSACCGWNWWVGGEHGRRVGCWWPVADGSADNSVDDVYLARCSLAGLGSAHSGISRARSHPTPPDLYRWRCSRWDREVSWVWSPDCPGRPRWRPPGVHAAAAAETIAAAPSACRRGRRTVWCNSLRGRYASCAGRKSPPGPSGAEGRALRPPRHPRWCPGDRRVAVPGWARWTRHGVCYRLLWQRRQRLEGARGWWEAWWWKEDLMEGSKEGGKKNKTRGWGGVGMDRKKKKRRKCQCQLFTRVLTLTCESQLAGKVSTLFVQQSQEMLMKLFLFLDFYLFRKYSKTWNCCVDNKTT